MGIIETELGGSWKAFVLSIPLDVITFLFLLIVSGGLALDYLGPESGKNPALLLIVTGSLFALYYIFLRRFFLESAFAALFYLVSLSAALVVLPLIPALFPLAGFILTGAAIYWRDAIFSRAPERATALEDLIAVPVEEICENINGVYVQQFLANTKSTFEAYRALFREGKIRGIPEMISAYPRRLLRKQLERSDVEAAIESTIEETGLEAQRVYTYLHREGEAFLKTQRETTVYGYEKVDIRAIAGKLEQDHSEIFYQYRPLHYEDLKKISEAEGLDVINLKDLEILAGLLMYTNNKGQRKYAILMRDDDSEHQALKEFAMAHELGHWFAHIKEKAPAELGKHEFYLNSLHDLGQFEDEANKIALITLFPMPYLARCEMKEKLSDETVFDDYIEGMRSTEKRDPEGQLKTNMMGFLAMRTGGYRKYKHTWLQRMKLLDGPLTSEFAKSLASYIGDEFAWAELNAKYIVIDSNEKFAALVGLSREELLKKQIDAGELSEPKSRSITSEQFAAKRLDLKPKFYCTRYQNLRTGEIIPVTIYAFPIVEGVDKYTGSFGIVTAVDEDAGSGD